MALHPSTVLCQRTARIKAFKVMPDVSREEDVDTSLPEALNILKLSMSLAMEVQERILLSAPSLSLSLPPFVFVLCGLSLGSDPLT